MYKDKGYCVSECREIMNLPLQNAGGLLWGIQCSVTGGFHQTNMTGFSHILVQMVSTLVQMVLRLQT